MAILKIKACVVSIVFLLCLVYGVIVGSEGGIGVLEVDTFTSSGKLNRLEGWMSANSKFKDFYVMEKEGDNYFLRARAKGVGAIIAKEFSYDLKEFPILTWRWRGLKLPKGGMRDIRIQETALQVSTSFFLV